MSGDSSREAIMRATFEALSTHGYADLTVQAIADEFEKSKSLILYHYDSKDALMAAFMAWLLEDFLENVRGEDSDDPATRLRRMARIVVTGGGDEDVRNFQKALLELRAQAPYNESLRSQLIENDQRIRERIAADVREGIETGQFREVDPEVYAATFRSTIEGAQSHRVILGEAAPSADVLAAIDAQLIDRILLAEDTGGIDESAGRNGTGEADDANGTGEADDANGTSEADDDADTRPAAGR